MPVGLGRTLETQGELCGDIHNITYPHSIS